MRCAAIIAVALPLTAFAQPDQMPPVAQTAPLEVSGADLMERLIHLTDEQSREHAIIMGQVSFEDGRLKIHDGPAHRAPMRREILGVLDAGQPIIELILEGAQRPRLDLGLPPGPLPADAAGEELADVTRVTSALRQAYRLLRLDIGWRLEQWAIDSAVERIEGGLGFCAAINDDAPLLVHLTNHVLVDLMLQAAQDAAGHPDITAEHRKRLLDQLDRFDADDPFNYGPAARANGAAFIKWLREECSGPEAGERLADIIEENGVPPDPDMLERMRAAREEGDSLSRWVGYMAIIAWPERPAAKLSEPEITRRIDEIEALLNTLHAAWASPAEVDALDAVIGQMERDDSQIAKLLAGLSGGMIHARQRGAEQLAETREALRR